MFSQDRPKWWQLYLTFPLLVALFAVDSRLKVSTRAHQVVQIGIVLIVFGLIHLWLKANARALSAMDRAQLGRRVTVISNQPHPLSAMDNEYKKSPMFQLSDSEIKGTLSETFEMDFIAAESFKAEEYRNN
jgi:hypothetical protein